MQQGRPTWAEVNLTAIRQNMLNIKALLAPGVKFCAVVKANAYGHGAVPVAREALRAGADYLAVAMLDEALELRRGGLNIPVLILGYTSPSQYEEVLKADITQTIFNFEQGKQLAQSAQKMGLIAKAHLKIDSGMGRLGVRPQEAPDLAKKLAELPNLFLEGVFTHFAKADWLDKSFSLQQFRLFHTAVKAIRALGLNVPIAHCANSAATLDLPETHLDMVRPGIIIYGLRPSAESGQPFELAPAMSFKTHIVQLRRALPGESLSYGGIYTCAGGELIATLPVGYADGWPRLLSNNAEVMVRGVRVPQLGRICMDQCMIDVSHVQGVTEGNEVVLFGPADMQACSAGQADVAGLPFVPVDELAQKLGTINYELVCMVGRRVPRVYFKDGNCLY